MVEYVHYYHEDRTHPGLEKQTPGNRKAAEGANTSGKVVPMPRLGGLHHRYYPAA
jgi:hypothetical protein